MFRVYVPATCYVVYEVKADSKEEAIQEALAGNGEPMDYDNWEEDVDSNNWSVEEV